jgi:hypothetical protein
MLTLNSAKLLLELCPICPDVQYKILICFLGYGTTSAIQIQNAIEIMNNSSFGSFYQNDYKTLWRYKVYLDKCVNFNKTLTSRNLHILYELRIAYLTTDKFEIERQSNINSLKLLLKNIKTVDLSRMFYSLDKNDYD